MKKLMTFLFVGALMSALSVGCNSPNEKSGEAHQSGDFITYYYYDGEKVNLEIRRDEVIIKTASNVDAKALSMHEIFTLGERAASPMDFWVIAHIDAKTTTLDDVLMLPGALDATYGLGHDDGTIMFPNNEIYVELEKGITPDDMLAEAGLADNVIAIKEFQKGYNITLNIELKNVLKTSNELYESGLCVYSAPSFILRMRSHI
ncbi:MAG: hypothetical protein LBR57_00025 [Alistipes sp.]|jgi:hypothetical protein|nr:hypothetical protein [Alistipes sp.]